MKTPNLLLAMAAAAIVSGMNLYAGDAYLPPRAAGNEIKHVAGTNADPNRVSVNLGKVAAPRTLGVPARTIIGLSHGTAVTCSGMKGSPRAVAECASHPRAPMPCCALANAK
ncbi:MAG TPA: hypothetical protein VFV81_00955 [Verrucomicrobiae bacterium]|nr:hypothetical protein [Verrucomicrobiae bacterium]